MRKDVFSWALLVASVMLATLACAVLVQTPAHAGRAEMTQMGLGDEIMASGDARRLRAQTGQRVRIVDRHGVARWHELWMGSPDIARPEERGALVTLVNGSGARPYIDYARTTKQRWVYTEYRATPGVLAGIEPDARGDGMVLIEPNLKGNASPNKQWGRENWAQLARAPLPDGLRWAQMCPPGVAALPGVHRIETPDFRAAIGVLTAARAAVLPEGGLHHAAAATGRRAVVLFGAMTSPRNTGYDTHTNLAVDDPDALGWRIPHPACASAWRQITPGQVHAALEAHLAA